MRRKGREANPPPHKARLSQSPSRNPKKSTTTRLKANTRRSLVSWNPHFSSQAKKRRRNSFKRLSKRSTPCTARTWTMASWRLVVICLTESSAATWRRPYLLTLTNQQLFLGSQEILIWLSNRKPWVPGSEPQLYIEISARRI